MSLENTLKSLNNMLEHFKFRDYLIILKETKNKYPNNPKVKEHIDQTLDYFLEQMNVAYEYDDNVFLNILATEAVSLYPGNEDLEVFLYSVEDELDVFVKDRKNLIDYISSVLNYKSELQPLNDSSKNYNDLFSQWVLEAINISPDRLDLCLDAVVYFSDKKDYEMVQKVSEELIKNKVLNNFMNYTLAGEIISCFEYGEVEDISSYILQSVIH